MTWVIKHSKQKASARFVLMMIANHAHADGTGSYPSVHTLGRECGMSERQIKRMLPELEASGELVVFWSRGRKPHEYAISMGSSNSDILSLLKAEYIKRITDTNSDILSPLTVTNPSTNSDISVANSDISVTPTVTFRSAHIRNKPSLEKNEEKSTRAATPTKAQERLKTRPDLDDRLWFDHLKAQDENRGIDIAGLWSRMLEWCEKRRVTPTRLRLLTWLGNERADIPVTYFPITNGNGRPKTFYDPGKSDTPAAPILEMKPQIPARILPIEQTHVWNAFRDEIAGRLPADVCNVWFKPLIFDGINAERSMIKVRARPIIHDWVTRYYSELICETLIAIGMAEFTIEWEVEPEIYEEKI